MHVKEHNMSVRHLLQHKELYKLFEQGVHSGADSFENMNDKDKREIYFWYISEFPEEAFDALSETYDESNYMTLFAKCIFMNSEASALQFVESLKETVLKYFNQIMEEMFECVARNAGENHDEYTEK